MQIYSKPIFFQKNISFSLYYKVGRIFFFTFAPKYYGTSHYKRKNYAKRRNSLFVIFAGNSLYQRMDKQKCIKALLDNLYEVYLQEGTIEKYQSHIQWAFKEAINNMRCFFKNDSFSCENEYRVILKIPEELLLEETTGQDGILKKGQFKRENILIPYVDYKFKRDSLKGITLNPYVKEKESVFELGIRELLWQNKIHNVQIYRSAIDRRRRETMKKSL